jgi:F0F1-type ATP synthase assembly protein I
MKQAAAKTTDSASGEPHLGASNIALTFLDTTWRISIPVALFALIGIFADVHLGTKPWLTLASMVVGFGIAGWLLKRQLSAVTKKENK